MRRSRLTKWILALLMVAVACQALVFASGLHDFAALLWGLSLAFLIAALVLAVKQERGASHGGAPR